MDGDWIRLGSVYLAYDLDIPSQSLVSLVECTQTANIPVILGCDANAHHDLWGSYHEMIYNYFLAKMQELDLHDMWFQQDGATCHTVSITMDLLRGEFGEHFVSHSGTVNWPPRPCDLTPLNYYCGAMLKLLSI